jgi:hypothetical protein
MTDTDDLTKALRDVLNHKMMCDHSTVWRVLWLNFLRGLAFGLGSVIGATILVYLTIQVLAQIEFIPILGDWAVQLIEQIETNR